MFSFNRKELKNAAKKVLSKKYVQLLLASLVLVTMAGGFISIRENFDAETFEVYSLTLKIFGVMSYEISAADPRALQIAQIVMVISFAWTILVYYPFNYAGCKYFVNAYDDSESLNGLLDGYKDGFGKIVITQFLTGLYIALWSLLLVVPGIVKSYSYRFVPYILKDHPELSCNEVITKSREMTNGIKASIFVLDLSFILWHLLAIVTLGISTFFVQPYLNLTYAKLYIEARDAYDDPQTIEENY